MGFEIPFNRPFISGRELHYIAEAVTFGNIAADGHFTECCARFIETRYKVGRALMTPSCTAALEMAAVLSGVQPGDEVLVPSYTFVSTASAFATLGAKPVFVDIRPDTLNIDENLLEEAITPRTKAIVPVHYAGVGCEMDRINEIARKYNLLVIEDAAQGVHASYKGRALGSIGELASYSFHETKNYICGEGGALLVNDMRFLERAEILRDKGTNRQMFFRGEVDKYTWVDLGSSYVLSELSAAFLYAQFEMSTRIRDRRKKIYTRYHAGFAELDDQGLVSRPKIPSECKSNYHMYYLLMKDEADRDDLATHLRTQGIHGVFHYVPLHTSPYAYQHGLHSGRLPVTESVSSRLLRLPFYCELSAERQNRVIGAVKEYLLAKRPAAVALSSFGSAQRHAVNS